MVTAVSIDAWETHLKNKLDPNILALGQALAEELQKIPSDTKARLSIEIDKVIDTYIRMGVESNGYEVELMLTPDGQWRLTQVSIPALTVGT